ncbi:lipoprotein-anchoring transpeptidase ErfK/SrfK [Prauserella sediminis]|uniref:Lipoprotein-anchoring transpeptidase ErfK/SrfK n=1 Tax=Prauserella sediminis TaxID=577680 RepID=A0A839Y037_9PSEU|nr:Ig-like domain-containing protein [Prauserella sediminis]MBB3666003.1 lipoprotein-anchoring transpeptidase ErfK/SrfK [Prauserella sediminis]
MGRWGMAAPGSWARLATIMIVGGVLAAGCTSTAQERGASGGGDGSGDTTRPAQPAELDLSVRQGADDVAPGRAFTATVQHGTITEASLVGEDGTVVDGGTTQQDTAWRASEPLGYGKTYTLKATAEGDDGETVTEKATFTTLVPQGQAEVYLNVQEGQKVGVGMPLVFTFSTDVPDRKLAERALRVRTDNDTEGAFRWRSDSEVTWRPKAYWEPGTKVTVDAAIYGKPLGGGLYGAEDQQASLEIGRKVTAIADGKSHHMSVFVDDERVRRMPISMGKPSSPTPNGTYTVMSEHNGYTMDSSTYGVPTDSGDGYRLWVEYATRMSYSGIFYHSAPWSVGYQGNTNTSHGCINLSTENAAWLMKNSKPGDLITVRNAGGQTLEPTDGWSVWQMSWDEWTSEDA